MSYESKRYKIESIISHADNVRLFRVKSNLNPAPGKFIEVSIPGIGECPLASCTNHDDHLDILTRNAGRVTGEMFKLKKGDYLNIRGPYGKGFPVEDLKGHNLILVAGGTGVAPITSMISYVEQHRLDFKELFIYFAFRDEEHILLENKIKRWEKQFKLRVALSNSNETLRYEKGYVNEIIEKHKPKVCETKALLCGPEGMMETVTKELNKLGLSNSNIYWSLERRMECGFGSCGRCQIQDLYVCKDGPVFKYSEIKPRLDNEKYSNKK